VLVDEVTRQRWHRVSDSGSHGNSAAVQDAPASSARPQTHLTELSARARAVHIIATKLARLVTDGTGARCEVAIIAEAGPRRCSHAPTTSHRRPGTGAGPDIQQRPTRC
jgi:hypothetical protein